MSPELLKTMDDALERLEIAQAALERIISVDHLPYRDFKRLALNIAKQALKDVE